MNTKLFSAALLAATSLAGAAFAQDSDTANWTGVYAGVNIGGAWGTSCATYSAGYPGETATYTGSNCPNNASFIGGGQIGYNYQMQSFVLGIEGDIGGATSTSSSYSRVTTGTAHIPGGTYTASADHTPGLISTIRARVGYSYDKALIYFTGGGAFAGSSGSGAISYTPTGDSSPDATFSRGATGTRTGWTLGGGVEYKLTPQWSIKAEDLFMNFGNEQHPGHCVDTTGGETCALFTNVTFNSAGSAGNVNLFRVGVNYKF